jgi:hypothetical protein
VLLRLASPRNQVGDFTNQHFGLVVFPQRFARPQSVRQAIKTTEVTQFAVLSEGRLGRMGDSGLRTVSCTYGDRGAAARSAQAQVTVNGPKPLRIFVTRCIHHGGFNFYEENDPSCNVRPRSRRLDVGANRIVTSRRAGRA